MRTASGILLSSAAVAGLVALAPARAAAPVAIEKSLLGIRILQNYKDVLSKWGPPKLIARGGETLVYVPVLDPEGNDLGGIRSISYLGGGSTGGGGTPGAGGPGKGGGSAPGMSPMAPNMGGGKKGNGGGGPGSGGGPGGPGGGAGAGGAGGDADTSFGEAGSYKWVYHDARHQDFFVFNFNLEGRVVYVVERGREGGMPTQKGIHLGSSLASIYETYGWPDTIQEIEPGFVLDYGSKYHAKFAVIKDKVVGIGIVLEESQTVPFFPIGGSGGGGGAAGPGGGGKGVGRMGPGGPGSGGGGGGGRGTAPPGK